MLTLLVVVWLILSPGTDSSHAVALALERAALVVNVATSRSRAQVRRARAVALAAAVLVAAVAAGVLPYWTVATGGGILSIAIRLALVGGLLRLVRSRGVTLQAVAGSLAIYLSLGLVFAWVFGIVAHFDPAPYFTEGRTGRRAPACTSASP